MTPENRKTELEKELLRSLGNLIDATERTRQASIDTELGITAMTDDEFQIIFGGDYGAAVADRLRKSYESAAALEFAFKDQMENFERRRKRLDTKS